MQNIKKIHKILLVMSLNWHKIIYINDINNQISFQSIPMT